jgi:hypothetical protein
MVCRHKDVPLHPVALLFDLADLRAKPRDLFSVHGIVLFHRPAPDLLEVVDPCPYSVNAAGGI